MHVVRSGLPSVELPAIASLGGWAEWLTDTLQYFVR